MGARLCRGWHKRALVRGLALGVAGSFFLAGGGATAASPLPSPIPIEALAELPFIADPALSPDGKRVAARINFGGVEQLAIFDLAAGAEAKPAFVPLDKKALRWFAWAGNGKLLIGHQSITFMMPFLFVPITRLARYDLATAQVAPVGTARGMLGDDVIFTDPDGRYILLSQQDDQDDTPSVDRIDLATGASVEVQKKHKRIWSWFADAGGTVRGGISYTDKRWRLFHRGADGAMKEAGGGKFAADGSVVETVRLLPGGDAAIIVTNGPTGRFAVYNYQLGATTLGPAVFEHPEVDVTSVQLSPDQARVDGVLYEDDRKRAKWFAPELQALQRKLDKSFPAKDNRIIGRSRDGNVALVWSGGADDPGTYYVFDQRARRLNAFASPYDKLDGARFSRVEPVRYKARDGLPIPAYLTLPAGRTAKGLPLIVMPHGGPFLRDGWTFDPWVQFLSSRGYAVLQPNFRGSTGFGRDFVESASGQFGLAMQDDLDDGIDWLAKAGTIDPARVCIMGASYGGYAALWGAMRNPERYRCAVSFAGVTDLRAMIKYDSRGTVASRYYKAWKARVTGDAKADLAAVSPLQQAARLKVPVLLAHGESDWVVPADQGHKLVAALRARKTPVQAVFYPGEGHGFSKTVHSVDFLKRVEAFLDVHNPADAGVSRKAAQPTHVAGAISARDYPPASRKKKQEGEAELDFLVTADGRVTDCTVKKSSGHAALDKQSCALAEERFQYSPARDDKGTRQPARVVRPVVWRLPAAITASKTATPKP